VGWGAAGGGYSATGTSSGGGAACIKGYITVTPGETLTVVVGRGGFEFGASGTDAQGGGGGSRAPGGGRSAIQRTRGIDIVSIAGGGGGGGSGNTGGAGGITAGGSGSSGAGGGSQSAGGVGDNNDGAYTAARNGIQFFGGVGTSGGGGGGWYGGGGGSWGPGNGSGGGGSSYTGNMIAYGLLTYGGSGATPGNNTDSLYVAGVGQGNNQTTGGNGLVWLAPYTDTNYLENAAAATIVTTVGSNFYTVPYTTAGYTVTGVNLYILGCGGQMSHNPGGGGAFVSGFYSCSGGTNFIYVVGGTNDSLAQGAGGGPSGFDQTHAGGFSGVFLSNAGGIVQSNAIAVAGGGGCGGYFGIGNGGGGGYPTGTAGTYTGYSTTSGGTQTAGGTGAASGSALQGGYSGGSGQSGGGGWYGGGSGNGNNACAGSGGSSYIGNINSATGGRGLTAKASFEQGYTSTIKETDAGTSCPYYTATVNHVTRGVVANTAFIAFVPTYSSAASSPVPYLGASTIFTSATCNTYTVPTAVLSQPVVGIYVYLWGGAGGYGNQPNGVGGSGGFVSGFFSCAPGTVLTYVLGSAGGPGSYGSGQGTILTGGGSGAGGNQVVGGGFSALFNCTTTAAATQGNVIALAGAGGASGQYSSANGGGGGYPSGGDAVIYAYGGFASGGSQTAGGAGSHIGGSGDAMLGNYGGGGGYFGGGGTDFGGGGGGSSYISGLTSVAYYQNGSTAPVYGYQYTGTMYPGGSTSPYYDGTAGSSTSNSYYVGRIVIIPAYSPPAAFNPASLSATLIAWFDGNVGLTTSSWTNRGTSANNATLSGVTIASQNGMNAASFTTSNSYGSFTLPFTGAGNDSRAVFGVWKVNGSTVNSINNWLLQQTNSSFYWGVGNLTTAAGLSQLNHINNQFYFPILGTATSIPILNYNAYSIVLNNTTSSSSFINYNGSNVAYTYTTNQGFSQSVTTYINGGGNSGSGATQATVGMTLCEVLVYNGAVSAAEGSNVISYLRTKWQV